LEPRVRVLPNGLTVGLLADQAAPLVSTALWYRAGAAHERSAEGGVAHFLEHMMFKGCSRFGPGEIDRLTLAVGGSNNAYTSHDGTVYLFNLPCEQWRLALEIEADRMRGLRLNVADVDAERAVIEEEIAEVDDDPWDALAMAVTDVFFGGHPYGRRILGTAASLSGVGAVELARFHAEAYCPGRAVLIVAGDVGPEVLDTAAELFGEVERGAEAPEIAPPAAPSALQRVDLALGETPRGLLALPSPAATTPEFVHLRLALTVLAGGRASPLQRCLVDEGRLCQSVSSEMTESVLPGMAMIAVELLPGVEAGRIEERVLAELGRLRAEGLTPAAVERGRRLLLSDWLFGHETIESRGASVGAGLALFGAGYPRRQHELIATSTVEQVETAARRFLAPEAGGVIGWAGT
jgi:zinc protease